MVENLLLRPQLPVALRARPRPRLRRRDRLSWGWQIVAIPLSPPGASSAVLATHTLTATPSGVAHDVDPTSNSRSTTMRVDAQYVTVTFIEGGIAPGD